MNINLSTVTESPKATKAAVVDGSTEVSEESSSEGFFSKLAALIKGESATDEKSVKADATKEAEVSEEPAAVKGAGDTTSADKIKNSSADELLSDDASSDNAQHTDSKSVKESDVTHTERAKTDQESSSVSQEQSQPKLSASSNTTEADEKQPVQARDLETKPAPSDAEKIVADNQEILKRLDQSNSALQSNNGKALPQEESQTQVTAAATHAEKVSRSKPSEVASLQAEAQIVDEKAKGAESLQSQPKLQASAGKITEQPDPSVKMTASELASAQPSNEPDAAIPAAIKPFVEQQVSDEQVAQQGPNALNPDNVREQRITATVQTGATDAEVLENVEVQLNGGEVKPLNVDANQRDTATEKDAVGMQHGAQSVAVDELPEGQTPESETAVSPELVAASATPVMMEKAKPQEVPVESGNSPKLNAQSAAVTPNVVESATLSAETPVAASVAAATAIPWAVSSDEVIVDEDAVLKHKQPQVQQAAVAQSVHQALSQSQATQMANAAQLNAASTMPAASAEALAGQLQTVVNSPVNVAASPVVTEQAMLKAAMGAKATGTMLNNGKGAPGEQGGTESGFSQQLAQAAGVQQANSPTGQLRADQTAQVPLQLNREIASDQVAERVQMMMSKNLKNIDIRLDPPELGRMQIRMNMNGDGATVHFTVANQQARDALEQSMPRLREMLAQQGVQLGDTSVQQQASGQQQNRYAANGQGQGGQPSSNQAGLGEENLEPDINLDLNVAAKRDGISYYA
ncbi:flagellar hook-length control protein FliK [Vibrio sp. MarTm2]|uniref:flagellar hook-length control protein FliK n=1 Tax=Vibrio sp. MarTm2 TaxID=2998831 RepID=UPI0022CDBB15|nr:flagellar hook-length control protein FliK [Vibrio sp. MarTm2]MDA0127461.1 flagellar hook-length control protein FliK [Vibrio sp. MarTm2]